MNKKVLPALLGAAVVLLSVTGCGGPQKDATYENATKLRDAVIQAGAECPGDAVKHDAKNGEDYLKCSGSMALSVYDKDSDADMSKTLHDMLKDGPYLMGPRWIIAGTDATALGKLKDKLGGSVVVP